MHYRNGREAKNGDTIVQLVDGHVRQIGVLHDAKPGNDHCNGHIAPIHTVLGYAELLKQANLDKRPPGK